MISRNLLLSASALFLSAALPSLFAQEPAQTLVAMDSETPASTAVASAASVTSEAHPLVGRWLDLTTFSHAERYRNAYNNGGIHVFEDGQQRSLLEGKVKLDKDDRYTIGIRASSGRYFNWAYADYAGPTFKTSLANPNFFAYTYTPSQLATIFGSFAKDPAGAAVLVACQSAGWEYYVRELYFSATPVDKVTVEVGSFGFERGYSSEITTFDEDGYLTGERVRVRDPKHLFFDEVGFTAGYFGSIATVNVFDRGSDYKHDNYRQTFAKKQLNKRLGISGEYTWQVGTDTLREAVVVSTPELKVADQIRFEAYQRVNSVNLQGTPVAGGSGFAIVAEKKITDRLSGDAGFDSVDENYGVYPGSLAIQAVGFSLNGDTYGLGKRPFTHVSYKVNSVITAFGFYTHAVGERQVTLNQQGMNAGLNFNLKALVNSEKRVF